MGRARFDVNNIHTLTGVSSSDGSTPVELWADPSTHALVVGASVTLAKDNIPASSLTQAVAVQIVDGSGNQISSFGGGTQYTDAGVPPAHPIAPTLLFNNAGAWATVGSATPLPVTGSLTVGGTTDNSAFTAGTTTGTPTMGFYHSTIDTVTDGRAAAVGITNKRAMLVTLQTSAGADTGVAASPLQVSLANTASNSTAVKVDGSAVTQPVSGTVTIGAGSAVIGHVITDTGSTTAVTGTVTISGAVTNAGTFAVQDTVLDAAIISQEATTSGVKGLTVFGAVTTNAPTYTTAKSDALSLDTSGLLRVSLKDTPANTNKLLVTADAITFASPQHIIADSGTISTITNVVHVDDNAGSLTVDNGGTFAVQATVAAGATNIAKAEDVASADADVGVPALAVRKATPANTSGTDGDYEFLQISAGRLWASATIDAALPAGAAIIGKVSIDQTTPGTTNLVALTAETTKVIGVTRTADGAGNLLTSNSSTFTAKFALDGNLLGTLGTAFSTAGKVDVKGADGDVFVRNATSANFLANVTLQTQTDTVMVGGVNIKEINAVTPLMGSGIMGTGSLRVTIASDNDALTVKQATGTNLHTVLDSGTLTTLTTLTGITNTVVTDDLAAAATGAAVPANAHYQGLNAQTALPAAASAGNLTGETGDKFGRQVMLNNAMRDIMGTQTTTITSSTSETTIVTAIASTFNDLVSVFISNTSATATRVDIRDVTAGSVIFQLYIPAGDMRGLSLTTPWPQTTVNTAWTATCGTSVADIRVSVLYIKNK